MANYGMLGALPPGLRGLVAAEQMSQQRGQNQLGQLGGILSLQGAIEQRQQAAQQQQELQNLIPQLTDPAARMLAQSGDLKGAIARQFPQEEAFTLGPGQQRFKGGAPVATVPDRPVMTNLPVQGQPGVTQPTWIRPGEATGVAAGGMAMPDILNPAVQAAKRSIAQAGKSSVSLSPTMIMGKDDDAYLVDRRKQQATAFRDLEKSAESAYKQVQTLDRFIDASKKGTAGGAQPIISGVQNFLSSFGYAPESLTNVRVMEQAIGDILGNKMAELGARGLTDKDMEILRQALPRVAIDAGSRETVAGILKKSAVNTLNEYDNARKEEERVYPGFAEKTPQQTWYRTWRGQSAQPSGDNADPLGIRGQR